MQSLQRVETRASYTDSLVNLLVRQASGSALGQASATAAVEAAVGLWSHAFAGARLEPEVAALSPDVLATIARSLILDGESLWVIDVEGGGLKLLPVGDHDVSGSSPDPATWIYRCSLTWAVRQHDQDRPERRCGPRQVQHRPR